MELKGKNALVTGGSRGIGRAISLALGRKGANVAVNFVGNEAAAEEVVRQLQGIGVRAIKVKADVSNFEQVQVMVALVKEKLGGIDILVNNAGITGDHTAIEEIGLEEWHWLMEVNLAGTFYCIKAAIPELKKNRGKIVNISSIAGKMGGTLGAHYAASKAGMIGMTFALASELAPLVTVNAVAPGPVNTDLISDEVKERLSKLSPMGRIATPEEIAHSVICLLENDFITGEVLNINGGRYMD